MRNLPVSLFIRDEVLSGLYRFSAGVVGWVQLLESLSRTIRYTQATRPDWLKFKLFTNCESHNFSLHLGFADLAPSNPKVTSKIIFDREYIITETKDPRWLYYDTAYYGRGWFRQKTLNPKNEVDDMKIKADFDTGYQLSDVSVVIEAFDYKRGNKMDCFRDSSPDLTYLIDSCSGNVRIRNLTSEEKEQIQQFKNEFEGTIWIISLNDN